MKIKADWLVIVGLYSLIALMLIFVFISKANLDKKVESCPLSIRSYASTYNYTYTPEEFLEIDEDHCMRVCQVSQNSIVMVKT